MHVSHPREAYLEVFKSEDVKNANRFKVVFAFDPAVDLLDHPLEAARIKCHGQGVSAVHCLGGGDVVTVSLTRDSQPGRSAPPTWGALGRHMWQGWHRGLNGK